MKYIKKFNEAIERSIEDWCKEFNITNYDIIDDVVNVNGGVNLFQKNLDKIRIQFGVVSGNFNCGYSKLISLKGCPKKVWGDFNCRNNYLSTLEGGPEEVGGGFSCLGNELTTLEGCPEKVGVSFFNCSYNKLTSLNKLTINTIKSFHCRENEIISLEGCPLEIKNEFDCCANKLSSLKGGPLRVGGDFHCRHNLLISFEGCPDKIGGELYCNDNPIYEIYKLFIFDIHRMNNTSVDYQRFKLSLDYNYLRGTNIIRGRFKRACEDAEIKMPDSIPGYKYIDL